MTTTGFESILATQAPQSAICEKVAAMAGVVPADIDPREPLQRYGVMSAQALEAYSYLLKKLTIPTAGAARWSRIWRPHPQAPAQLVCFHHAGGGASMFRSWPEVLGPDIEVCAVQLPGREERLDEPPHTHLGLLLDDLVRHLLPRLHRPCAFFGHSMGSLVAFELARRLAGHRLPGPALLLLSGYRAPGTLASAPLHGLPELQFREALRRHGGTPAAVLGDDAMMQAFSPLLRADLGVGEEWRYRSGPPLDCPIVALAGADDPIAPAHTLEAFASETRSRFGLHTFPGGHFFVNTARDAVLAAIRSELTQCGLLADPSLVVPTQAAPANQQNRRMMT